MMTTWLCTELPLGGGSPQEWGALRCGEPSGLGSLSLELYLIWLDSRFHVPGQVKHLQNVWEPLFMAQKGLRFLLWP